jgi:phage tail sheath protein FI
MPQNQTSPGVYVQEVPGGVRTITGVSTSITAFLGSSTSGPLNQATRIRSMSEFRSNFDGLAADKELGYAVSQFFANGGADAWIVRVADTATPADWQTGLTALDSVDIFNLLALPGVTAQPVIASAAAYCEKRRAFLLLDSPPDIVTPQEMAQYLNSGALPASKNAALYYPWVEVAGRLCAPSGTIAGLICRIDGIRGVWKSPAGTEASLTNVTALKYSLSDAEDELLNSLAVNCLRMFSGRGMVAWGARTLAGADSSASEWKSISVRRLTLFLEESIDRGVQWVAFEPNGEPLWDRIRQSVWSFLNDLFRQGAFQGVKPSDAFVVKCDATTTTQDDVRLGIVKVLIGFAPLKPAEFVILTIEQKAGRVI